MGLNLYADVAKAVLGPIIDGASNIIKDFKADPNKVLDTELALAKLKSDAELSMQDQFTKLQELQDKEMADARNREIQIATSDKAPLLNKIITPILALAITALCFTMWYIIVFMAIPADKQSLVSGIVGSLTTVEVGVIGYYFGSSSGSADKSAQLNKMSDKLAINK